MKKESKRDGWAEEETADGELGPDEIRARAAELGRHLAHTLQAADDQHPLNSGDLEVFKEIAIFLRQIGGGDDDDQAAESLEFLEALQRPEGKNRGFAAEERRRDLTRLRLLEADLRALKRDNGPTANSREFLKAITTRSS